MQLVRRFLKAEDGIGVIEVKTVTGQNIFIRLVDSYLADFLWAFAMFFCINAVMRHSPDKKRFRLVLCLFVDCVMELLQAFDIISGTFDFWDIVIQILATLTAYIIINIMKRKKVPYVREQKFE